MTALHTSPWCKHRHQLHVSGCARGLPVETSSPCEKSIIMPSSASSSESLPERLPLCLSLPGSKAGNPESKRWPWGVSARSKDVWGSRGEFMAFHHLLKDESVICREKLRAGSSKSITQNDCIHAEQLRSCHHQVMPPCSTIPDIICE